MHMIADLLAGFPNFLLYFSVSIVFVLAFKFVYVRLTPYDEWHLIKEEKKYRCGSCVKWCFSWLLSGYCRRCD